MEYAKGKNTISRLIKAALSIGTFILLAIAIPFIAIFIIKALFFLGVFGALIWGGFKLIKGVKSIIYKINTKGNTEAQANMFNNNTETSDSIDINYEDSVIIDVDYEDTI